ncbi:MAG: nucleoside hydrolase-like domain-containing protein [Pedobacter sp.]|uniref:nucleoside hydrolase-like domain-containing protein n=1 Tax=Pedobacter sp. TaxID=1411316 RepID=UPI003391D58A
MNKLIPVILLVLFSFKLSAQKPVPVKPRVLISTDIGGTDPDDNQSMAHLLMYNNLFHVEGLVSSPSYGNGTKGEILRMIGLYEKDLPKLQQHVKNFASPDELRAVTKQGRHGAAPYKGYDQPSEGSDWIIKCAKKQSDQPLWILVWGGLEDLAQALHDAPEIRNRIKVYFIGGPNKKWSANSYAYIAQHFPDLWFIESNSSYYGFFSSNKVPDSLSNQNYYKNYIREVGYLGKDYKNNHYQGRVKMGDTPSLLYMMDGDPLDPSRENWGGSYEKFDSSPRIVFNRNTTIADTLTVYSIVEFHFKGPKINIPADSACFTMTVQAEIGEQKWDGFYLGKGDYVIRYSPKRTEKLSYKVTSGIPGFREQKGEFVVDNIWPGKARVTNYRLGKNWYTDRRDPELFDGIYQGGETVRKWRSNILLDWAKRWEWLR